MKAQVEKSQGIIDTESQNFSYRFDSSKSSNEIFKTLLQPKKWWVGFYDESITGKSENLGDEFEFLAGGGVHYSKHRLIELIPNQKIIWEVTDSNLSFLTKTDEWIGTKIAFDINQKESNTLVTFTHAGLTPKFECYGNCSGAWTQYMEQLKTKLS